MSIYKIGLSFFCALHFPSMLSIYKPSYDHFDPFCTFQDMAQTGMNNEQECPYVTKYACIVVHNMLEAISWLTNLGKILYPQTLS